MNKSSKTRFVNSLIVSILLTLLFSFNFTVPSVIRELVRDPLKVKDYHKSGLFHVNDEAFGRLFLFPCLGAGIGCLLAQLLKLELRRFLILGNVFFTLGTFLQFWLKNYFLFLMARVLIGVGTGIVCAIVPTYLSIISPLEKRGFYCSLQQIALASGFLLASICRYTFNNERWKVPFFSSFVVSVFIYGLLPFVEDPILTQNKGKNLIQLFRTKEAFLSILTGMLLHLSQHLASINVIICYTDEIFKGKHSYHILFNVIQVLFTCINGFFIDKFGRKQLLLLSISITSVALSFLSYNFKESFFAFVYIAGFCIGSGPVIWYLSAEIFPPDYVVTGTSFLSLTNWIWGWIQPKVYFMLKNKYGERAYLPFTVCLGLIFVYFVMFLKETKGRVLDFQ